MTVLRLRKVGSISHGTGFVWTTLNIYTLNFVHYYDITHAGKQQNYISNDIFGVAVSA